VDPTIVLAGAVEKHPGGPALGQPFTGCAQGLPITGTAGNGVGPAGFYQGPEKGHPEQLVLGHEGHGAADGVADQRRVKVGAVVGDHYKASDPGHMAQAGGVATEKNSVDRPDQQAAYQCVAQVRLGAAQQRRALESPLGQGGWHAH
jgi:hypothetical protein